MNFKQLIVLFILAISIFGCSSNKFTVSSFLEKSGRSTLPTQSEFPEDGAVYLYENTELKMFFDDKWQASVEKNYHVAILYFNDKAESYLTPIIYLNKEDKLVSFKAKTIKPNGEILELTRNDLHANQISSAEFTDNESVKFTFPGVESGCVVEYQYSVMRSRIWIHSQRWKIQDIIPKLYTKYAIEFPQDYLNSGHGWNFLPVNINLSAPKIEYHMKRSGMLEYGVAVYSWELENILGMKSESYMPPYEDVAQYLRVDFRYDSWNDLSEKYWKRIKDKFQPQNISDFNKLRKEIVGDATSDAAKIDSIFSYLQTSYRYVSSDIDNSGTIPHDVDEILRNKYGDCKDLSVLGTALLTSARVEAYPALVKTNTKGILRDRVVLFDFNHMIIYTKASDGKEYWLDATGNSCNLGETYPMIEGTKPLVLYNDGRSEFKKIPASKSHENLIFRNLKVNVDSSGNFTGNADILFKGNYNLIVRSGLRSLSKSEMEKAIQKYAVINLAGITIDSIKFDNPAEFAESFKFVFHFSYINEYSGNNKLLVINPSIFKINSELNKLIDLDRKYPIQFSYPSKQSDLIEIYYSPEQFSIESQPNNVIENGKYGRVVFKGNYITDGKIVYNRDCTLKKTKISPVDYSDITKLRSALEKSENQNLILKKL